jgi:hypothetical protein
MPSAYDVCPAADLDLIGYVRAAGERVLARRELLLGWVLERSQYLNRAELPSIHDIFFTPVLGAREKQSGSRNDSFGWHKRFDENRSTGIKISSV